MRSQWKIVIIMCRYADLVQAVMDCAQGDFAQGLLAVCAVVGVDMIVVHRETLQNSKTSEKRTIGDAPI
mgnify:CR=1 FL=1